MLKEFEEWANEVISILKPYNIPVNWRRLVDNWNRNETVDYAALVTRAYHICDGPRQAFDNQQCSCFYCCKTFPSEMIDRNGWFVCPFCKTDAVVFGFSPEEIKELSFKQFSPCCPWEFI
jgi:hypothetical protein